MAAWGDVHFNKIKLGWGVNYPKLMEAEMRFFSFFVPFYDCHQLPE